MASTEFTASWAAVTLEGGTVYELQEETRTFARLCASLAEEGISRELIAPPACTQRTSSLPDGFHEYLVALREQVIAFRKPVAYVHGDPHYLRVDKPLVDAARRRLENFTRVETFGDNQATGTNDVHGLKVVGDSRSREVFSFQPQIVPTNRTTVPNS